MPGATGVAKNKPEKLVSNILPVISLPERLYLAETPFRTRQEVYKEITERKIPLEFVLRNKRILTPRDLSDPRYEFLCDRGSVEDFSVDHWAKSTVADERRDFVSLLNQCLKEMLWRTKARLRYNGEHRVFYFPSNKERTPYSHGYQSEKNATVREVVKALKNKKLGHIMGFRHVAAGMQFYKFNDSWYLEITPTYIFTNPDGKTPSKYGPDWLSGIKKIEKNNAVLGQLRMWGETITERDLFGEPYAFLALGGLLSFEASFGIDDDAWTASDEILDVTDASLPVGLF